MNAISVSFYYLSRILSHPSRVTHMSELSQISIGKFSIMTQLTTKALRLYDQKGILVPNIKDPVTGYRYYEVGQVEIGVKVKMLATLGFGLDDIARALAAAQADDTGSIKDLLARKLAETQAEIARLKKVEELLVDKEKTLELFCDRTTTPVLKDIPTTRILCQRERGDYNVVPMIVMNLIKEISSPDNQRNFVKITGPFMYICHDPEFKEGAADIEMAVPISGRVTIQSPNIELRNLPGGRVVSAIYTGPYEEIAQAYTRTHEYVYAHGLAIRGPSVELYLNNPQITPPAELLTEIQVPIE